ncbi:MAG: hypothetical protein ACFCU3_09675 [Verrucomicrobiales bacterium]
MTPCRLTSDADAVHLRQSEYTMWLEEENIRRDRLVTQGCTLAEANAAIVIDA